MVYTPQTWDDLEAGGTPISAARLQHIEDGVAGIGSGWATWVPTAFGLTIVDGTLTARYTQFGKTVLFNLWYTAGASDSWTTVFQFSLPVTTASIPNNTPLGVASMLDGGSTSTRRSGTSMKSSSGGTETVFASVDSLATSGTVNSTVPWTWAATDVLYLRGMYEAA